MQIPQQVDVTVIGGGIVGCATAYFLAQSGASVALCEKGEIGIEQSTRNWGFVRKQGRDPAEIPLMVLSEQIWKTLDTSLGQDLGLVRGGTLYLSDDETRYEANQRWLKIGQEHDLDTVFLSLDELQKLIPDLEGQTRGALFTPSDMRAEPVNTMKAFKQGCEDAGVNVLTYCAARGLDISAGRVSGVVTEHGLIKSEKAVLAGGAWSRYFCRNLDIELPQLKVVGSVLRTQAAPLIHQQSIWSNGLGIRRRQDGGYNVAFGGSFDCDLTPDHFRYFRDFLPAYRAGKEQVTLKLGRRFMRELMWPSHWSLDKVTPFENIRALNPKPNEKLLQQAHTNMGRLFPSLKDIPIAEKWAGMIDVTPDELPVIDQAAKVPGFYLSTGYSGHGFGIGPGAGKVTSDLVLGNPLAVDIKAFSLARF